MLAVRDKDTRGNTNSSSMRKRYCQKQICVRQQHVQGTYNSTHVAQIYSCINRPPNRMDKHKFMFKKKADFDSEPNLLTHSTTLKNSHTTSKSGYTTFKTSFLTNCQNKFTVNRGTTNRKTQTVLLLVFYSSEV
jgi:hypothetical protein